MRAKAFVLLSSKSKSVQNQFDDFESEFIQRPFEKQRTSMTIRQLKQEHEVTAVESYALNSAHALASASRLFRPTRSVVRALRLESPFLPGTTTLATSPRRNYVVCWQQCFYEVLILV